VEKTGEGSNTKQTSRERAERIYGKIRKNERGSSILTTIHAGRNVSLVGSLHLYL
jgi:hypothetical protein